MAYNKSLCVHPEFTNFIAGRIFVPPVLCYLASSVVFSVEVGKTIQSGHVNKFLLSALSAATAITAQHRGLIHNRHLTHVISLFSKLHYNIVLCATQFCFDLYCFEFFTIANLVNTIYCNDTSW
jgi:hypothetical protein